MNGLYLKARWIGNRWLIIVNTLLLSMLTLHSVQNPSGNNAVLQGNDGPKEAAAYYLVGGDAASFGPETKELVQLNKAFSPDVLSAAKGSTITFPNKDSFTHNVYSPEGVEGFFDLGSAGTTDAGNSNLIQRAFPMEGVIKVSCAVHPIMKAHIFIVPSKYHTASKDGAYTFADVPAGTYDLMVVTGSGKPEKMKSVTF